MQDKFISVTTNSFSSPMGIGKKRNGDKYLINTSEIRFIREYNDDKSVCIEMKGDTIIHINEKFDEIQAMFD